MRRNVGSLNLCAYSHGNNDDTTHSETPSLNDSSIGSHFQPTQRPLLNRINRPRLVRCNNQTNPQLPTSSHHMHRDSSDIRLVESPRPSASHTPQPHTQVADFQAAFSLLTQPPPHPFLRNQRPSNFSFSLPIPPTDLIPATTTTSPVQQSCVVCQDEFKTVVLLPCRHLCLCLSCSHAVIQKGNCPLCRTAIKDSLSVFI
mmetsp:Transcript_2716/g.3810  ORF Transcript_2716/g.3810 Transcript_2716/m.3810 type:complete len:201 (+) Transcript_2716:45-647(+)